MRAAEEVGIPLAHGALAAKCWGDPRHPPLLALHGWLDNAGSFDFLAPRLADDGFRVVALDLGGHGRSAHRPPGAWYHYVDYFDDVHAAFAHFGWTRAGLLGHSLGGTLASLFAALYPERVGELFLIEALGPLSRAPEDTLAQLRQGLDERAAFARRRPLRVFPDLDAAIEVRSAASGLGAAAARALVERGVVAADGGYVWSSDPRLTLASPQRFGEAQVLAMLGAIRAQTTLVLAEPTTPYLPKETMDARAACVAGIRVVRVAGGHHVHMERADVVADAFRADADQVGGV